MRYETPEALRRAIQDRIRRQVQERGASDARLRTLVVFERFFARLNAVVPDRWALKGALALDLRFAGGARATMDADIALHGVLTEPAAELPRPPATWAAAYRRSAAAVGIDPDLEAGWRAAAAFLNPILRGEVTGGTWDPELQTWT